MNMLCFVCIWQTTNLFFPEVYASDKIESNGEFNVKFNEVPAILIAENKDGVMSGDVKVVDQETPTPNDTSLNLNKDIVYDKRKLRNHWPYLAEGIGGMGVLLNEKEAIVTRILGQATRRSFDTFDEMYYERRVFSGIVYIYKGHVTRLRYYVKDNQLESLKWKTAGGLRQEMIENMTEKDAKKFILEYYKNSKYLIKQGSLLLYSKGIGFYWNGDKLRYIELFEAWHLPQ
ncbi:MAG: hypothetical protein OEV78_00330 [Spirochaetia bacterium]|nr:hypothetical protein [Spirochaetia bacterium]